MLKKNLRIYLEINEHIDLKLKCLWFTFLSVYVNHRSSSLNSNLCTYQLLVDYPHPYLGFPIKILLVKLFRNLI